MKRYITWKPKRINAFLYEHPNTNNRVFVEASGMATLTETPYQMPDGRFIAVVEYADDSTEANIQYFMNLDTAFEFTFISEETTNSMMLTEYGTDDLLAPLVYVANFIFTDNRL